MIIMKISVQCYLVWIFINKNFLIDRLVNVVTNFRVAAHEEVKYIVFSEPTGLT